jgi:hypothetical protein
MATIQEVIQGKIIAIQDKAAADIAVFQADLAQLQNSNPSVLQQDVELVKVWFQSLKNHIEGL